MKQLFLNHVVKNCQFGLKLNQFLTKENENTWFSMDIIKIEFSFLT